MIRPTPQTVGEMLFAEYQDFVARKLIGDALDAGRPLTVLGRDLKPIIPVDWVERVTG